MKQLKARWFLFGAQAVLLHGAPRTTQDIDVTVLTEEPSSKLLQVLKAQQIIPRIADPGFLERTRVLPCDHLPSGWKIDLVLGGPGFEELIAKEAELRKLGSVAVPLLRIEHLIVLKVLAGRPQDLADVAALLGLPGSRVAGEEIKELLREFETALAEDRLVERFERLESEA